MQRLDFRAMGCKMLGVIDADGPEATEQLAELPEWFADWEKQLSRFLADSELNRLNRAQGAPFHAGRTLVQVLERSLAAAQASGGLVTPAVLDAINAAGYDRSFEELGDVQGPTAIVPIPDWRSIRLDKVKGTIQLPQGMRIDFGGIAKGWAADEAVRRFTDIGPTLVDAGGDIAVSGPMVNSEPWAIGIADPYNPEENLALALLDAGGVATSGRDYRHWMRNGKMQHHIIDPRTGSPADTDIISATVIGPSAAQAEVAAKVVLILGSTAGLEWLEERPEFAGFVVLASGQHLSSSRMEHFLWHEPASFILGS